MSKLLVLLLILVGCGKKQPNIPTHFSTGNELMADEIKPYFNNFLSQAKCLNKKLSYGSLKIVIAKDKISSLGLCVSRTSGEMTITLDQDKWESLSYANREKVMVHELIHCTQGRMNHANQEMDMGVVMGPELFRNMDDDFMTNYDFRIKEAFGSLDNTECDFAYRDLEPEYLQDQGGRIIIAIKEGSGVYNESRLPPLRYGDSQDEHLY